MNEPNLPKSVTEIKNLRIVLKQAQAKIADLESKLATGRKRRHISDKCTFRLPNLMNAAFLRIGSAKIDFF
jgi:hypothetical protein